MNNQILKYKKGVIFMTKVLSSEKFLAVFLAGVALLATFVAQLSSSTSVLWIYYQPEIPQSLVKKD